MIELKIWNKDRPDDVRVAEHIGVESAGVFLAGVLRAAVDNGGTVVVEAKKIP